VGEAEPEDARSMKCVHSRSVHCCMPHAVVAAVVVLLLGGRLVWVEDVMTSCKGEGCKKKKSRRERKERGANGKRRS
jgi:hypothetical protein